VWHIVSRLSAIGLAGGLQERCIIASSHHIGVHVTEPYSIAANRRVCIWWLKRSTGSAMGQGLCSCPPPGPTVSVCSAPCQQTPRSPTLASIYQPSRSILQWSVPCGHQQSCCESRQRTRMEDTTPNDLYCHIGFASSRLSFSVWPTNWVGSGKLQ
jgi:hypothetical protein